jgi:multidrug efflux pump
MNGKPAVLVIIFRQPGANIIETVDRIRAALPQLESAIPQSIDLTVAMDQTVTIRASVQRRRATLIISVLLVILVVFFFLRNVPHHLHSQRRRSRLADRHFRRDVSAGLQHRQLVADGADHLDRIRGRRRDRGDRKYHALPGKGMQPFEAALKGAQEIGFTVLTISISLIAVFIPLLLMGGIVGRLFREFAVTLSVAIAVRWWFR